MKKSCLKSRKDTKSKNLKPINIKNGNIMLLSNCAVCDSKKSNFFKKQEASRISNSLKIKTSLSKIASSWKCFILRIIKEAALCIISDCVICDHKKSRFLETYGGSNKAAGPHVICCKNVPMKQVRINE